MKKLSEIYKELGIAFTFPIEIKDAKGRPTYFEASEDSYVLWCKYEYDTDGNETYFEDSDGWRKKEYDANGNVTYREDSYGYWGKREYDARGNETYCETSSGYKQGTPRSAKTCEGEVIEMNGIK